MNLSFIHIVQKIQNQAMCTKLSSKTLNPHAKEWKPTPKGYPRPPPPQPAAFNPFPPNYYPNCNVNVQTQWPLYSVHLPSTREVASNKATMAAKPKLSRSTKTKMEGPELKSPKCPPSAHVVKGFRRAYPPRIRRSRRCYSLGNPPPQKLGWRPKEPAVQAECSEGAAGNILPPTLSDRRRSRPENTTVMMKNIPNQLRRDFMLNFLDDYCRTYGLEYDFLYLPMDFGKNDNLGYAFVNFTTSVAAQKFKEILHNYKWATLFTSKKVCDVTWARIQGLKALIDRFRNSSFKCDRWDYLPVQLDPPRNGSDPNPCPPVILGSLHQQALKKTISD